MFRHSRFFFSFIVASLFLAACQEGEVSAERRASEEKSGSLPSSIAASFFGTKVEVPAGTAVQIRLLEGVSSEKHTSGKSFRAQLDEPLRSDGRLLAPAGSDVTGEITHVQESGKVKGRAEMTLTLRELTIDGEEYDLRTHPITIRAEGSKKKDAAVITGTTAAGAVIGAIAGGKKGAAIGAGIGAGTGTGIVLTTQGKEVEFDPETRFAFTLARSLSLPVYRR